mgnify:CR=1 FL=1
MNLTLEPTIVLEEAGLTISPFALEDLFNFLTVAISDRTLL